ncbi:hypothetical protein BLOT_002726 [Blomia tropicalis]|nr:hypothetical protein BLOT_002726 [Blomia tropicalis]
MGPIMAKLTLMEYGYSYNIEMEKSNLLILIFRMPIYTHIPSEMPIEMLAMQDKAMTMKWEGRGHQRTCSNKTTPNGKLKPKTTMCISRRNKSSMQTKI